MKNEYSPNCSDAVITKTSIPKHFSTVRHFVTNAETFWWHSGPDISLLVPNCSDYLTYSITAIDESVTGHSSEDLGVIFTEEVAAAYSSLHII